MDIEFLEQNTCDWRMVTEGIGNPVRIMCGDTLVATVNGQADATIIMMMVQIIADLKKEGYEQ